MKNSPMDPIEKRLLDRMNKRQSLDPITLRPKDETTPPPEKLPENLQDFIAVADADYQVRGSSKRPTIWDKFTQERNLTPAENGVDRDNKWKEDIQLMKDLGVKNYRTSISMSRILRQDGSVDMEEVKWYRQYFQALNAAGIKIHATLYHWELPADIHGGWTSRDAINELVKHAQAVATYLDDLIEEYFILNEPWCVSHLSYDLGVHAPGEKDLAHAVQASHNLLVALGKSFEAIKNVNPNAKIGTVFNLEPAIPASSEPKDIEAAKLADGWFNGWFLDPLYKGGYPKAMVDLYTKLGVMAQVEDGDMEVMKKGSQFETLGINFYCPAIVSADSNGDVQHLGINHLRPDDYPKNDLGWIIDPSGIYEILKQVWEEYKEFGLKNISITETGTALSEPQDDVRRVSFYREHIRQVLRAVGEGVPVRKFFAWTFMDNFEWAEGYKENSCFGIVNVDRQTMKRTPKASYYWLQELIKTGVLK